MGLNFESVVRDYLSSIVLVADKILSYWWFAGIPNFVT